MAHAGAGAATATRWSGVTGSSAAAALDVLITNHAAGTAVTSGTSAATSAANELVIALAASTGSPVLSAEAFTPVGTTQAVPDTAQQSTGACNNVVLFNETLS